jgi:cold shock CspA family protein
LRLYFAARRRQGCVCAYQAVQKAGFNGLVEDAKVAFDVVEYRGKQAAENMRVK